MTALAACLFALAALSSVWIMVASWRRHGAAVLALPAQLRSCPTELTVRWRSVERIPMPVLAPLRAGRGDRRLRQSQRAMGLEWPGLEPAKSTRAA